ncbi:MAG: glutathione transferase GstA, partial [Rhizobiales bacterium]|nr:glutathione transferase GstA [Hyphomicrobiales bacterium]
MQLYYAPGACSLAPHIVGREAGLALDLVKVDLAAKKTADGGDFLAVNAKGYVPAIKLDNGEVLTEAANVVGYIADQKPDSGLAPAAGGMERYRYQEWLTFVSSELHKGLGPLFNPKFS